MNYLWYSLIPFFLLLGGFAVFYPLPKPGGQGSGDMVYLQYPEPFPGKETVQIITTAGGGGGGESSPHQDKNSGKTITVTVRVNPGIWVERKGGL